MKISWIAVACVGLLAISAECPNQVVPPPLGAGIPLDGVPPPGAVWTAPIREIAWAGLSDIAYAWVDQFGPVIYYNPTLVQKAGPFLSEFFRAHEYGHHLLGHVQRVLLDPSLRHQPFVRQSLELEADCFATQAVFPLNSTAVGVTYNYFLGLGSQRGSPNHPTFFERANIILQCAQAIAPQPSPVDSGSGFDLLAVDEALLNEIDASISDLLTSEAEEDSP